ncbi:contact-dependent growth inhibition system immunity protein [Streptomyces sp. NPDC048489]|uniref:contact-dependent growth inhibition system immunity protein n=1 Tax=Streptomyces sp. NPDC048489 TaxID=3154504 RepID=UPI003445D171
MSARPLTARAPNESSLPAHGARRTRTTATPKAPLTSRLDEYDPPIEALNDYMEVRPPGAVNALRDAIGALLDAGTSEQRLAELWLKEGNAYYDPRSDSTTMTDWFRIMLSTPNR